MTVIPTFQNRSARYGFDIELGDKVFHLIFSWNDRDECWYMDIQDSEENNILNGIKLTPNYQLLKQYKAFSNLPDGEFILWDLKQEAASSDVNFDTFGTRYQLIFLTTAEIIAGEVA